MQGILLILNFRAKFCGLCENGPEEQADHASSCRATPQPNLQIAQKLENTHSLISQSV